MPNIDSCHDQVVNALSKEGWQLEQSPYTVILGRRRIYIDGLFSRGANGAREQLFLLEIKCFSDLQRITSDIYISIGQYLVYKQMLAVTDPDLPMYISIPLETYTTQFDDVLFEAFKTNRIRMVIVDLEMEQVTQWIR
jgi:hypothetical protein